LINFSPKCEEKKGRRGRIPSERQPQLVLCKESREVNRAEAVALCNGVKDNCAPANCTGSLNSNHNHYSVHKHKKCYPFGYLTIE